MRMKRRRKNRRSIYRRSQVQFLSESKSVANITEGQKNEEEEEVDEENNIMPNTLRVGITVRGNTIG